MGAPPHPSQPLGTTSRYKSKSTGVHPKRPLALENGAWLQRTVNSTWPGDSVSEARSSAAASSAAVRLQHGRRALATPWPARAGQHRRFPPTTLQVSLESTGVGFCTLGENIFSVTSSLKSQNPQPLPASFKLLSPSLASELT